MAYLTLKFTCAAAAAAVAYLLDTRLGVHAPSIVWIAVVLAGWGAGAFLAGLREGRARVRAEQAHRARVRADELERIAARHQAADAGRPPAQLLRLPDRD